MPRSEPDSAFGETGPQHARLKAIRNYFGDLWAELLSEQGANEQLETQKLNGLPRKSPNGRMLGGWPYTPAFKLFSRCPSCGRRKSRCRCAV